MSVAAPPTAVVRRRDLPCHRTREQWRRHISRRQRPRHVLAVVGASRRFDCRTYSGVCAYVEPPPPRRAYPDPKPPFADPWSPSPYATGFNRTYGRSGHLFGSRYHSTLILDDAQLLEVTRYIHLNPVRAGLVRRPEDFSWSSYRSYITPQADDELVNANPVLSLLALERERACAAYEEFVLSALAEPGTENIG